jgi:predicted GIY-YIG superfamily endonuclease
MTARDSKENPFFLENRLPKTPDAIGKRCAADGCGETKGISYEKPLCWDHWKEFDRLLISECERCHWFDWNVGEVTEESLCFDCVGRERRGDAPVPMYAHGPVEIRVRYLYILKLAGGKWYVGQTNSLELRLKEHIDGMTPSTMGKEPKLVWYQKWGGQYDELIEEEDMLTRVALENPRAIARMVEEWQKLQRLVDLKA